MAPQNETPKNGILDFMNRIAPTGFVTIVTAALFWVAGNTTSANVQLAVIQESINNLKKDLVILSADRYTVTQANSDRGVILLEITHLKDVDAEIKRRITELEKRPDK